MKSKLSFFAKVRNSMFNIKSYPILAKQNFSSVLGYILILSILVGGVIGISQFALFKLIEKSSIEVLEDDKFTFTLNNGILDFKNSPYNIEEANIVAIIDTAKSLSDKESLRSSTVHKDMSTVFLKDGVIVRYYGEEFEIKYSDIDFLPKSIDNSSALELINKITPIKYILLLINIILIYFKLLISSLLISIIGVMTSKIQNIEIKYIDILKISLFSLTLPTLFQLILPIGSFSMIVSALYVSISMKYFRDERNNLIL